MVRFGPFELPNSQIFWRGVYSYATVNLRPVVAGHVLVIPYRVVVRVGELEPRELVEMWSAAQRIGVMLERLHGAKSLQFVIQDGPDAGQTVPHVHIHVLPRKPGDFPNVDDVYNELAGKIRIDVPEKTDRSAQEMQEEAELLTSELGKSLL